MIFKININYYYYIPSGFVVRLIIFLVSNTSFSFITISDTRE